MSSLRNKKAANCRRLSRGVVQLLVQLRHSLANNEVIDDVIDDATRSVDAVPASRTHSIDNQKRGRF